jgi:hypothetical protein
VHSNASMVGKDVAMIHADISKPSIFALIVVIAISYHSAGKGLRSGNFLRIFASQRAHNHTGIVPWYVHNQNREYIHVAILLDFAPLMMNGHFIIN